MYQVLRSYIIIFKLLDYNIITENFKDVVSTKKEKEWI